MNHLKKQLFLSLTLLFVATTFAFAQGFEYEAEEQHKGNDVTPIVAHIKLIKDPEHSFLVDVRTRAEHQFVGHPEGAYNIPLRFFSDKLGEEHYTNVDNLNFGKDLLALFNPKTDNLFFMCRSGARGAAAADEAVKAGWPEERVFNIMGGFEGYKITYKNSSFYGQRRLGGWRNEGLPWTYDMDMKRVYQRDVAPK